MKRRFAAAVLRRPMSHTPLGSSPTRPSTSARSWKRRSRSASSSKPSRSTPAGPHLYDKKSKDLEIKELVSFSNKRPIVEITTAEPALIEKKVLKAKLLVVSKTNEIQSSTIKIPDGWRYVDHNVIIESKNGNASYTVNLEQNEDGQVQLVTLSANVSPSSFSSYKNWMALDLIVNIEAVN